MTKSPLRILILLTALIALSGCQKFLSEIAGEDKDLPPETPPPEEVQVETFHIPLNRDPDCLNSDAEACLFFKNPVTHGEKILETKVSATSDLDTLQTLAVPIDVPEASEFLDNGSFQILSTTGSRVSKSAGHWRIRSSQNKAHLSQVMAYFWLNYAAAFAKFSAKNFWAENQNLKVMTGDEFSGWNPQSQTIHVRKADENQVMGFNGGLLIYSLGLANLHFGSQGQINDLSSDTHHRDCQASGAVPLVKGCCKTANGCSKALSSGSADYFVAMIFSDHPTLGEAFKNDLSGLQACGQSRDLRQLQNLEANEAFAKCTDGREGYTYTLGSVYASIWFELRKVGPAADIDQIYMNHLPKLSGEDDFLTAYQKIIQTENALFGGKYSAAFRAEFLRRGLAVD